MPIATGEDTSGLISPLPAAISPDPVITLDITNNQYANIAIDTRWTPISSILSHVEGSAWTVDYYSQVLTTDSQLAGQQVTTSGVFQQYTKIEKLELRVSSPLSQSQDPDTKTMSYAGTAYLYSGLIPNEGDMLVAGIDNGQSAIFKIIGTIKKSIFRETVYEINYIIETTDADYLTNLNGKVVNTYVYRKDFLTTGQNPLVVSADNDILMKLGGAYSTLCKQYFPRYYNKEYCTMILPGQEYSIYDPFFTKFIMSAFGTDDHYLVQDIKELNTTDDGVLSQTCLWDAILNQDFSYITTGWTQAGYVSTNTFSRNPFYNSIRFTGINLCAYPIDPRPLINNAPIVPKLLEPFTLAPTAGTSSAFGIPANLAALPVSATPNIYPVTQDAYYVLSSNFYTQTTAQSVLESIVSDYLQGKSIDLMSLYNATKLFMQWGALEQFYYVPIVLYLIRASIRGYQG